MKQPKQSTRRTRARRGIYYRVGTDGRRHYEITYTDSDGRQRWQAVDGGIDDAEQIRADVLARKRKGGRVAPSKQTFEDAGRAWLDRQTGVRPRTREAYDWALRVHLNPEFGRLQVAAISEDRIAAFIADKQKRGLSGHTIRGALKPLRGVLNHAARTGQIPENPMSRLERSERPSVPKKRVKVLGREEIGRMLDHADEHRDRPLLTVAVFTGLRVAELCGLTWGDIDFDAPPAGIVHVRYQLDRATGKRERVKTDDGERDIVLMPAVVKVLKAYRLRSTHSRDTDFVFPTHQGKGLDQTVARRALERALEGAGLDDRALTFHGLRHTFASLLIAQGEDVLYVARQLGHSDPHVTLSVYGHLFDSARHAATSSAAMEASYGPLLADSPRKLAAFPTA